LNLIDPRSFFVAFLQLNAPQQIQAYSITSSALASSMGGTVSPKARAVGRQPALAAGPAVPGAGQGVAEFQRFAAVGGYEFLGQ
jgi:hypothetical protein